MQIRINRYIAQTGQMSRRHADEAVAAGRVLVNGRPAGVGDMLDPDSDEVCLDGKLITRVERTWYLALNKPKNMLTTMHDPQGRPCIRDIIPRNYQGVFPTGRLDFDAKGLILLTNDGDLAHAIHHPSFDIPKVYIVELSPQAQAHQLKTMADGVILDGKKTRPALVEYQGETPRGTIVRITLRQGLKNQIKRMAEAVDLRVNSIERIAVGPVQLKGLKPGTVRELTAQEIANLKKLIKDHTVT